MRPNPALRVSSVPPGYGLSSVPKNAQGGVLVSEDELTAAFAFFDVDGSGKIATSNIRKRPKNMPAKNYRFPMKNKPELTLEGLKELLLDNEVANYDPDGTGFVRHGRAAQHVREPGLREGDGRPHDPHRDRRRGQGRQDQPQWHARLQRVHGAAAPPRGTFSPKIHLTPSGFTK